MKRSSIAIRPIGPKVTANRDDQRAAESQFKQPSSRSTGSLSTASLSTSTTKKLFDAPAEGKVIAWGNALGWSYAAMFRAYRRFIGGSVGLLARTRFWCAEATSWPLAAG